MKILKFGGTSVDTPERILHVIHIIETYLKKEKEICAVFSAFSGVTDRLIEIGKMAEKGDINYIELLKTLKERHVNTAGILMNKESNSSIFSVINTMFQELGNVLHGVYLIKELSPRTLDFIMSFGERLSASIISEALNVLHIENEYLDAGLVIKTDNNFGNGKVNQELTYNLIKDYFHSHRKLQIITGFIASTEHNEITTLGRGGSDYSASIFGSALDATEIEIWTDVDGIMTTDPKKVKKAFPVKHITYKEAMEMSHFGAKVIYPPTLIPAFEKKIPVRIKNTFNQEFSGTVISDNPVAGKYLVKGISSIENISLLRVEGSGMIGVAGIAMRLFGVLAKGKINIILITQASSEHSICFAISPDKSRFAKKIIEEEFSREIKLKEIDEVIVEDNFSIIGIVGENMKRTPGISGRLFQALGKNGINVVAIAQGSSELNISVVINKHDEAKALNVIHEAFFLSDTKSLHIFLVGTGQIGHTLIKQIERQKEYLLREHSLDIKLTGIANTRKMFFDEDGISLLKWKEILQEEGQTSCMERFIETMKDLNLANSVFIDCTASEQVIAFYKDLLKSSISIVTPNKKANARDYKTYKELKDTAAKYGVKYLYETNVGAALPVISTLKDLISSGDKILKIEAILSGTLSYIFNNFTGDRRFSTVVKEAKDKGFTEPDPRDDLNSIDAARKLLILARETGLTMELEDIKIEGFLPKNCQEAETVDEFMTELEKSDDYFETIKIKAENKEKALRYISSLKDNRGNISLEEIDRNHPFFTLSGSDNIIAFTTERYKERPLVVKGPGAGAEVTASGVFADIIRISDQ